MPGPGFTTLFGGNTVYPAQPTYLSLNPLTASIILQWPFEQQSTTPTVAEIVEVNATVGALTVQLSDARQISTGYCTLFNNIGANTFTVLDANGGVLAAIPSGTVWELYLADNSTLAGTWRVFQFGAGVSSANAAALAGAGLVAITTTLNQNYVTSTQPANYNAVVGDRAKVIEWTGGTGTVTLPVNGTLAAGWFCAIKNLGTGIVTVAPSSGTIDGSASLQFQIDNSSFIIYDGANFYTLGFGQIINSVFDFIQISLNPPGTGTIVLAGAQLNRVSYKFVGALTGNVIVQVPGTVQQYWVDNETTGAFTLTVSTGLGGTTTTVGQGQRNILYSDGTNVVPAVTFASTGFADGSAVNPSIFFSSSPHTGLYKPAADQIAIATNSVERVSVDDKGHVVILSADNSASPALTVNNTTPGGGSGPTLLITSFIGMTTITPGLLIKSTAGGAGFASMVLQASGTTLGTTDCIIQQSGATFDMQITNHSAHSIILGTNNVDRVTIDNAGQVNIAAPSIAGIALNVSAANGFRALQCSAAAGVVEAAFFSSGSVGSPAINLSNSDAVGATGPVLTANKPGPSTNISRWIAFYVGGVLMWVPAWAN